jgi:cyclase
MTLAVRVIPCLDVANGRVVKGVNFENLRDSGDPVERATHYFAGGADELTFLDVTATIENRTTMYDIVERTAETLFIPLTVGGGIRSTEDVARLLGHGADKISVSSAAIARPGLIDEIAERFGAQVLVVSLDVARSSSSNSGWVLTTHGGRTRTEVDVVDWTVEVVNRGAGELLVNSIDADGTRGGFDLDLISAVRAVARVPLIASGGAGRLSDFAPAVRAGADAVLAASVFHADEVTIGDVKGAIRAEGFEVRS